MKTLINISGGAIKFIALIACFRKLINSGIKPKAVSGVSSGAIIALFYVCGKLDEAYKLAKQSHDRRMIFSRKNDPVGNIGGFSIHAIWKIITGKSYAGVMDNLEKNIRSVITPEVFSKYKSDINNTDCWILSVDEKTSAKVLVNLKYLQYESAIRHVIGSSSIAPLIKPSEVSHKSTFHKLNDGGHRDHSAGGEVLMRNTFNRCITIFSRPGIEEYQDQEVGKNNNFINRLLNFTVKTFNKEISINDEHREFELCKKMNCEYQPVYLESFVSSNYDITTEQIQRGIYIGESAANKLINKSS